jgi:SAM-dependent methyltransferase
VSEALVDALDVASGERVLDVGCGDGNTSIVAARRGASVVGIDLTPAQVELARARLAIEGVPVDVRVGDAEALPVEDHAFDVVMSCLGMIFAADHERATAEMVRACRAGGRVGATSWGTGGWSAAWAARAAEVVPEVVRPSPWADPAVVRQRWEHAGLTGVNVEQVPFEWHFADVDAAVELFLTASGPFIAFVDTAESLGRGDDARTALRAALAETAIDLHDGIVLPHPFIVATGTTAG